MNGEGKVPRDASKTQDIHRLLLAAEHNAQRERELQLLAAAREGNIDNINNLVIIFSLVILFQNYILKEIFWVIFLVKVFSATKY